MGSGLGLAIYSNLVGMLKYTLGVLNDMATVIKKYFRWITASQI